mgnify:CR=1 FL=1
MYQVDLECLHDCWHNHLVKIYYECKMYLKIIIIPIIPAPIPEKMRDLSSRGDILDIRG